MPATLCHGDQEGLHDTVVLLPIGDDFGKVLNKAWENLLLRVEVGDVIPTSRSNITYFYCE